MVTLKGTMPEHLVALANELARAKRNETGAKERRVAVEEAIIAHVGFEKSEGQETYRGTMDGGSSCELLIKQPINAVFDSKGWPSLRLKLNADARKAVATTYKLDTKEARALQNDDPESWGIIASLVTRKPGKISVEIKALAMTNEDL